MKIWGMLSRCKYTYLSWAVHFVPLFKINMIATLYTPNISRNMYPPQYARAHINKNKKYVFFKCVLTKLFCG